MLTTIKGYIDLAVGILVLLLIVACGWFYDQHKLDESKAEAAAKTVAQLQQGLAQLQQGQTASNEAINNMEDALLHQGAHAATIRQRVVTMGNDDATVQKWLDAPLPVNGCMLDDTCPASAAAGTTQRGAAAALPASAAHAVAH